MVKILIIEDDQRLAEIIRRGLEEHGYKTEIAYDGEMGLKLATASTFELIISDLVLPGMNGYDVCRKVRIKDKNTPILMLTALGTTDDKVEGFEAGVEPETLQTIYLQNREILSEVEVAIYDPHFNLLYHDAEDIDFVKETPEMIDEIMEKGEIRFIQEGWEVIGIRFQFNDAYFVITAAAYDEYGHNKLKNLRNTLLLYCLGGVVLIFLAGTLFSRKALNPVAQMREKVEEISAKNLNLRLREGKGKDELAELAITFNRMLDRIEQSFMAQKEFVSNISHELRTPLTAITGEIELSLSNAGGDPQMQKKLQNLLEDARRLSRLTNNLLHLANASYDPHHIRKEEVRIDEVLLDARQELQKGNPDFKVDMVFEDKTDDESFLIVEGNAYMLQTAFLNLMHNGCKFSNDHKVTVKVMASGDNLNIMFADQGIGIPEDDLPAIFSNFFRGSNHSFTDGSGIGLPLVQRIITLHHGTIDVVSEPDKGSVFTIVFKRYHDN